jgi:predicted secreted protein
MSNYHEDTHLKKDLGTKHIEKDHGIIVDNRYKHEEKYTVPVTIKMDNSNSKRSNYFVVVGEDNPLENEIFTKYENIDISVKPKQKKMDYLTQFYIGSITVVGLYVFYRLLNKTK